MLSYGMEPSGVIAVVEDRPHGFRQLLRTYASYGLLVKVVKFDVSDLAMFVPEQVC